MIFEIRIPTEQYGFVHKSFEDEGITPAMAKELYLEWLREFTDKPGLPDKEFNLLFDDYCWRGGSMNDGVYSRLNRAQMDLIQAVKRSKARAAYKVNKEQQDEITRINNLE